MDHPSPLKGLEVRQVLLAAGFPMPFDNTRNSIFADFQIMGDPAIAATLLNGGNNLWCKPVRFWPLPRLTAKFFAAGFGGRQPRFHPLANQVALKLGNACQKRRHHPSVRCAQIKGHAAHCNQASSQGLFAE